MDEQEDTEEKKRKQNLTLAVSDNQKRLLRFAAKSLGFSGVSPFILNSGLERAYKFLEERKVRENK